MPQLALLNIPVCTKNAITLVSSTGTEDAFELWSKFVDLRIYSLPCYTCNPYNYYWILNRTLLQMSFQYNKEPLWKNTILSNYMPTSWEISWYFNEKTTFSSDYTYVSRCWAVKCKHLQGGGMSHQCLHTAVVSKFFRCNPRSNLEAWPKGQAQVTHLSVTGR